MILTTITPYWNRPKMLDIWIKALEGAYHPDVRHILLCADEGEARHVKTREDLEWCRIQARDKIGQRMSIGYMHNAGAALARTEWIMKLDVDAIPNVGYFKALLPILHRAGPREWFNGGMIHINQQISEERLSRERMPLEEDSYLEILNNLSMCCSSSYLDPASSNFICRREDYLGLGGCDLRFRGWGWEDYQQLYMLEKHQRQQDPLIGTVTYSNVTNRCRDEISRPKAKELFARNKLLCLFHHWHPSSSSDPTYKSQIMMDRNRGVLLSYILQTRMKRNCVI